MDQASSVALSQEALFWLSICMLLLGALIVVLIILFAVLLLYARRWQWRKQPYPLEMLVDEMRHFFLKGPQRREALAVGALLGSAYSEHLARRNEFWMSYGQTTVAVLLLIVVTVLLLTRTIDPDAGLPILSGIAGFAIAKTTGSPGSVAVKPPDLNQEGPQ